MTNPAPKNPESGFTLLEVAITLLMLAIFLAAAISLYQKSEQQRRVRVTMDHMRLIVTALSSHAEAAGRLPCPADPGIDDAVFGWEWGVDATDLEIDSGGRPVGSCGNTANGNANDVTGIVPFQALNLPHNVIRDGWGRYFTYSVSPAFTQDNDRNGVAGVDPDADTNVHAQCRTAAWVTNADTISSYKARFCCAGEVPAGTIYDRDTDLRIRLTTDPGADISPRRGNTVLDDETGHGNIATLVTLPADGRPDAPVHTANPQITAPAFVLVSHGTNGDGAFLGDDTRNRFDSNTLVGTREEENNDRDRLYFTGPRSEQQNANNYFDDIVIWMTQDGIMAANGTSSCQYP